MMNHDHHDLDRVQSTTPDHHGRMDDGAHGMHDGADECSSMNQHSMMMVRGHCKDTMHVA